MKTKIWMLLALCLFTVSVMAEEGPADARRHMIRGVAAIEMAKSNAELTLAADEFRRATELDPSLSAAWYNLGSVQAKLGQFDEAIESYKRYLTLAPKAEDAQKVQDEMVKLEFRQELLIKSKQTGKVFKDCADCPEMVVIPSGSFTMGSPGGEQHRDENEGPQHTVSIPRFFAIGKTEVTQGQWKAVMENNPSYFKNCGDNCPVEQVSWNDAKDFIQRLNAKTGKTYYLPSEAEWEYACRAGGQQTYCGSDDSDRVAWYLDGNNKTTHAVAGKQANAWGLHDMSGNVREWVEDCYNNSYNDAPTDASAWANSECELRVQRGGSWNWGPSWNVRSAMRNRMEASRRYEGTGFRLARTLP